jgi:hypothetical protein
VVVECIPINQEGSYKYFNCEDYTKSETVSCKEIRQKAGKKYSDREIGRLSYRKLV